MKSAKPDPFNQDFDDAEIKRPAPKFTDEAPGPRVRRQRVTILHVDDHVVVIDQPPFAEPVISENAEWQLMQDDEAVDELVDLEPLFSVVPVEEGVSGTTVLARSPADREALLKQLQSHEMEVMCLALVRGLVVETIGTIDVPLITGYGTRGEQDDNEPAATATCRTDWQVRDSYVGFALLECRPRTVARDQVQMHLQAAGLPLAVAPRHDGPHLLMLSSFKADYHPSRRHRERPLIERTSMHFESATFRDLSSGKVLRFETRMAHDFRATVNQLGRFGRMPKG